MGPGYYDLYYGGFSPLYYIAMLALLAFSLYAQIRVKTSFSKYSAVHCRSGMTGAQAAQAILRANGITDVRIEPISGDLTDHYDPRAKVIRLSGCTGRIRSPQSAWLRTRRGTPCNMQRAMPPSGCAPPLSG